MNKRECHSFLASNTSIWTATHLSTHSKLVCLLGHPTSKLHLQERGKYSFLIISQFLESRYHQTRTNSKICILLLLSIHKNSFDLGSGGAGRSQTIRCVQPATHVFQLKIHCADMQLCLVHASSINSRELQELRQLDGCHKQMKLSQSKFNTSENNTRSQN